MSAGTDERAALAAELAEIGQTITVTRSTPGTYNPATGSSSSATTANYTGKGRVGSYSDYAKAGTLILQQDRKVTWQPDNASFVPQEGDTVSDGTNTYTVVAFDTRELEGDWICYTLQVRG